LDEAHLVIQINFTVIPKVVNDKNVSLWKGVLKGSQIQCQWVLWLNKQAMTDGAMAYSVFQQQTPAGYDLQKYNESEQKSKDENYQQAIKETSGQQNQYTYKIDNNKCSISYNGGKTWIEVPLVLKRLVSVGDGTPNYYALQEGSYLISPQKTAFLYGGGGSVTGLEIIYSEDEGKTWHTSEIDNQLRSARVKFISFPTSSVGYAISSEGRTMSQESQVIYKTTDGGVTWKTVGYGPKNYLINSGGFSDESVGFISYPKIDGEPNNFYRTEDGGKTFKPVTLPVVKEEFMGATLEPFVEPKTPYIENGKLLVLVGQGPQGDYKGGRIMGKYQSNDKGKTWTFIEQVDPSIQTNG
jgi:hypothetical protein